MRRIGSSLLDSSELQGTKLTMKSMKGLGKKLSGFSSLGLTAAIQTLPTAGNQRVFNLELRKVGS
jgi:hypothetical protein